VFGFGPATRIYLAAGVTDMRQGFDGLYAILRAGMLCPKKQKRARSRDVPLAL
jgi:hypothetical protein